MYQENHDEMIEKLILDGSLEVSGIDESGELTYQFTEKLQEQNPELAEGIQELFHIHVMALWELGFLDMNPTENNPMVRLTTFADDGEAIDSLHPDLRRTLFMIKARFAEDE
jgi:hypothetical protein